MIALHAWLSMTRVLDDPYTGNILHDINLEEVLSHKFVIPLGAEKVKQIMIYSEKDTSDNVVKELELRIWGSSQLIKQQNLKIKPGITTKEDVIIQEELWKLIKPEN